jgi:tetratricopeptide (TPR) repeat protein
LKFCRRSKRATPYEEAEAAYHRALSLNPELGVAIIHLGNLRFQKGRYAAAAEQYRRYIQIARDDKQRARGFGYLAWLYLRQGELAQAATAAKEEMKYDPTAGWHSLMLALQRGDQAAAAKLSDFVFAPANYNNYNERGNLRIWNYQRGYVALRQGRADEAINHFRAALSHRAVEWNIDSYESCLADALLELGRADEAISEHERILKINPHYPLAHYHLGQTYERQGDAPRARAAYDRFLQTWREADADIPEVIAAKARLAG